MLGKKSNNRVSRNVNGILGVALLVAMGILTGVGSEMTSAVTYQSEESIFFTFNPAMSLTVSGDLNIDDLAPGLVADSNIITVTAGANSSLGYTLYANVGDADNNYTDLRLVSTDDVNKFAVLPAPVTTLNDIGSGKWGYSYCDATSSAANCNTASNWVYGSAGSTNTGYGIMPLYNNVSHATDVKIADTSSADATTVKFKIGAKSSDSQVAGTYTNVINFIGIPKIQTVDYTLSYVDRSGTVSSSTMPSPNPQTGTTTDGTFTISNATPINTNTNLSFLGWCTVDNASDITSCSGTMIHPGSMYVIANPSAIWSGSVYAVWKDNTLYMQDIAEWKNTELPNIGDETIAVDKRDGKKYYVAKLLDGNIWMTQNLDFNIGSATINSSNTDVPANWSDSLTSTYSTGTTTWNYSVTAPESYDPSDRCWNGTPSTTTATIDTGTTACASLATAPNHYHIGNYYNWTAAVAMADSSSYTEDNTDVNQSICPAGWMLPKKTGSGSFYNLVNNRYTAGTSGNIHLAPPYFVYGGYWGGSSRYLSSGGLYWSSVVYDSLASYILYFNANGYLFPQYDNDRYYGYSVRCIARP